MIGTKGSVHGAMIVVTAPAAALIGVIVGRFGGRLVRETPPQVLEAERQAVLVPVDLAAPAENSRVTGVRGRAVVDLAAAVVLLVVMQAAPGARAAVTVAAHVTVRVVAKAVTTAAPLRIADRMIAPITALRSIRRTRASTRWCKRSGKPAARWSFSRSPAR